MFSDKLLARYWAKVDKQGPDNCWNWQARANTGNGYGRFYMPKPYPQRMVLAHRLAYELAHGPIPPGQCVLHKCDNRLCCNPNHHFLGTRADNNKDTSTKGRARGAPRGEAHHSAKLTGADIPTIKLRLASGDTQREIARDYQVSQTTILRIGQGKLWRNAC